MHCTDEKKPTGDGHPTAGGTDRAMVPDAPCTGNKASHQPGKHLLALGSTINHILLRAWCAAPSGWGRATVRAGASHTTSEAADLPDSEVFSRPEFKVLDVGSAYPQGRRQRFGAVTTPHIHSVALVRHGMVFVTPEGAETMTASPVASRSAAPTTTHHLDPIALHGDACNALSMALHYLRQPEALNVAGAARKTVQALAAMQRLAAFERLEATA